jgi:AhpD family alkylhydroperoxidase
MTDPDAFYQWRRELNELMYRHSPFLKEFNAIDVRTYQAGAIPAKYKELMGLSLAVGARCDQCVRYHVKMCIDTGATAPEMTEAVEVAIVTAGSWSFPQARLAFEAMRDFGLFASATTSSPNAPSTPSG